MRSVLLFLLSLATLSLARDCNTGNYTHPKDGTENATYIPHTCVNVKSRCIKIVTELGNTVYVTRTCGPENACDGKDEMDIVVPLPTQPGIGKMYCCDRNSCNHGDFLTPLPLLNVLTFLAAAILTCILLS